MQTKAQVTTPFQTASTHDAHFLPLWTRFSDFVLKRLLGDADAPSLSIEERWDSAW